MSATAWAGVAALVGPILAFITWMFTRRQTNKGADFSAMAAAVQASLDTTKTMQTLLGPLEKEIAELRVEVALLRAHITGLEHQIKALGYEPLPPPRTLRGE